MNKYLKSFKWKLILTLMTMLILSMPLFIHGKTDFWLIILITIPVPILTWLVITWSLNKYGENLKKDSK